MSRAAVPGARAHDHVLDDSSNDQRALAGLVGGSGIDARNERRPCFFIPDGAPMRMIGDEPDSSLRSFRATANPAGSISNSQHHDIAKLHHGDTILAPSHGGAHSVDHAAAGRLDGAHEDTPSSTIL